MSVSSTTALSDPRRIAVAASAGKAAAARPREGDSLLVTVIKALLYALAITFYLFPLSSPPGIGAAIVAAWVGMFAASRGYRASLRVSALLVGTPVLLLAALLLGDRLLDSSLVADWLGAPGALVGSDVVTFGLAGFVVVFFLRSLAYRVRALSILEVAFVAGSVATVLAAHRGRMLNRPRFLTDWAWSLGIDPTTVLIAVGAGATLLAVFLFLRRQTLLKLLMTLILLLGIGALFYLVADKRISTKASADALGLSGKKNKSKSNNNPFKDNYNQNDTPRPVAVAILRDDYSPDDGLLYFRQNALSKYNGNHLVADPKWDVDVIKRFPRAGETLTGAQTQNEKDHLLLPTTMYLLVDHPQPPALTHAKSIKLIDNPNPKQFVAAYEVKSLVPSVSPRRLLGRASIGADWSADKRRHYTEIPDDPRYKTLADIIVQEMDPRFSHDDLAKAYAIKRYLEKNGFYTRKSKHSSKKDPTASFLFGSLRGYCVHFAHAAVYLFRSQGIAARVALGYAVQTRKRSGGSSILIMGDRAHAWPEIYLDGVGWVTFDVYPEHTDMPPRRPVDYDLEKLLGELARKDTTGGRSASGKPMVVPWGAIGRGTALVLAALLALAYLIKGWRRLSPAVRAGPAYCRAAYIALLDRLSDLGAARRPGETREKHAARLAALSPSLDALTRAHLGMTLGSRHPAGRAEFEKLVRAVDGELKKNVHPVKRAAALLNPFGWLRTR